MTRPTIKLGKSVSEKMDKIVTASLGDMAGLPIASQDNAITQQDVPEILAQVIKEKDAQELILAREELRSMNDVQKVMREHRLVKKQIQTGVKLDDDLHQDFKIACTRERRTMDEIFVELVSEFVRKSKKRFEK